MPRLESKLLLPRCPHCRTAYPHLGLEAKFETKDCYGQAKRNWAVYSCRTCGGAVLAGAKNLNGMDYEQYPKGASLDDESVPERARDYLKQAIDSLHTPAGAVMLAASAVDAMLKAKNYREGSLHARIEQATEAHLITEDMGNWAHQVLLDANDQSHPDESAPMPTAEEAKRSVDFAKALAQFLFTLPAMVTRGIKESSPPAAVAQAAGKKPTS